MKTIEVSNKVYDQLVSLFKYRKDIIKSHSSISGVIKELIDNAEGELW